MENKTKQRKTKKSIYSEKFGRKNVCFLLGLTLTGGKSGEVLTMIVDLKRDLKLQA
jgi:hypothetical protein